MQGWSFDARTVAPTNAFGAGVLPDGWYKVIIRASNIKPTNSDPQNSGKLELKCEVLEGQFQGRPTFWNLNIFNQSQQAVEIAYKQLSALCAVTGVYNVAAQQGEDNAVPMLHNIPFFMQLSVVNGQRGQINNVVGLKDINGNEPGKSGGGQVQQPSAPPNVGQAPGSGQPSWGAAPSQVSAPGGWQGAGAPAGGAPQPQGGGAWSTGGGQPQPQPQGGWGAPPGGAPQGQPPGGGQPQWGGQPQGQPPAGGAPAWGAPQPQGGPPPGQPWQGGGAPQGGGQPGGQQWQPPGGQPAGGPPQGGAPWGR